MKKVRKITVIALAFAFVLASCSNPNNNDPKPRKSVTNEQEARIVSQNLSKDFQDLITSQGLDMGITLGMDLKNKDEMQKMIQHIVKIGTNVQSGVSFDESCSLTFVPGLYLTTFGSYDNKKCLMSLRQEFDKELNKSITTTKTDMDCDVVINDIVLFKEALNKNKDMFTSFNKYYVVPSLSNIKSAQYNIKSDSTSTVVSVNNVDQSPISNGNNEVKGKLKFDEGTYNGIVDFDIKVTSSDTTNTAVINATFYDINGKNPHGPFTIRQ